MNRSRNLVLRLVLLTVISSPSFCLGKKGDFTVQVDSRLPDQISTTTWLGYLLARAKYREDHKLPLPESGDIVPTFQEEVYARATGAQIYQELKAQNKGGQAPYWETVSEVKAKGFLDAYVWTYLRRDSWPKSEQPKDLAAFESWSQSVLKDHKVETHGSLVVDRK